MSCNKQEEVAQLYPTQMKHRNGNNAVQAVQAVISSFSNVAIFRRQTTEFEDLGSGKCFSHAEKTKKSYFLDKCCVFSECFGDFNESLQTSLHLIETLFYICNISSLLVSSCQSNGSIVHENMTKGG